MNLFSGLKGEHMSMYIQLMFGELGTNSMWEGIWLSGSALQELKRTGTWNNKQVFYIKHPDGAIWDCIHKIWKDRTK